jgi:hypothetical protein
LTTSKRNGVPEDDFFVGNGHPYQEGATISGISVDQKLQEMYATHPQVT